MHLKKTDNNFTSHHLSKVVKISSNKLKSSSDASITPKHPRNERKQSTLFNGMLVWLTIWCKNVYTHIHSFTHSLSHVRLYPREEPFGKWNCVIWKPGTRNLVQLLCTLPVPVKYGNSAWKETTILGGSNMCATTETHKDRIIPLLLPVCHLHGTVLVKRAKNATKFELPLKADG